MDSHRFIRRLVLATILLCVFGTIGMGVAVADEASDEDIEVEVETTPPGDSFASGDVVDIWVGATDHSGNISEAVEDEDLTVTVEGPDGETETFDVTTDDDGSASVAFEPEEHGDYQVTVEQDGETFAGTLFQVGPVIDDVDAFGSIDTVFVNEETTFGFLVREGEFGAANESVSVAVDGPQEEPLVDEQMQTDENGFVEVSFTPEEQGDYSIEAELQNNNSASISTEATDIVAVDQRGLADDQQGFVGEEATYSGYLRTADGQLVTEDIHVTITESDDEDDEVILDEEEVTTNEGGFFTVDYDIPEEVDSNLDVELETAEGESIDPRVGVIEVHEQPDDDDDTDQDPEPEPALFASTDVGDTASSGTTGPGGEVTIDIVAQDEDENPITDEDVQVELKWDWNGPPLFSDSVTLDEEGEASTAVTIPDNALDDVRPSGTVYLEHEDELLTDSISFSIEEYDINVNRPFSSIPGGEEELSLTADDQLSQESVEGIPLQYAGLYATHKDGTFVTEQLVTDDDGEASAEITVPTDVGLEPQTWRTTRYRTGSTTTMGVDRGTLLVEGEESGSVTAAPGEAVTVGFETEADVEASGVVSGETFDSSVASFGTEITSEENATVTVPEFARDGETITLVAELADEEDEFHRSFNVIEVEVETPTLSPGDSESAEEVDDPTVDTDNIDLFDRAPFTLRADTDNAATTVSVDDVFVDTQTDDGPRIGNESAERSTVSVFDTGTTVELDFSDHPFADTEDLYDDGQLVVSKFEEPIDDDEFVDAATLQDLVADGYTVINRDAGGEPIDIQDGETTIEGLTDESGQYIVHLVGVDEGDGFTAVDGELHLDGEAEVMGVEQIAVQAAQGDIQELPDSITQGDDLTVTVDSNLDMGGADQDDEGVDHTLLAYDVEKLEEQVLTILANTTEIDDASAEDFTLQHDILALNGVTELDEDLTAPELLGLQVEEGGERSEELLLTEDILDRLFNETDFDRVDDELTGDGTVIDASMVSAGSEAAETDLTLETLSNWETGEYEILYAAQVGDDLTTLSTQTDNIVVEEADELPDLVTEIEADAEQRLSDGLTADVTVENDGDEQTSEDFPVELTAEGEAFGSGDAVNMTLDEEISEPFEPGESETLEFDLSDFVQADDDDRPAGNVVGDVELTAEADPNGFISELSEVGNVDTETVDVTYVNFQAEAAPREPFIEGVEGTYRSFVTNTGTAPSEEREVTVTIDNGNGNSESYTFDTGELGSSEQVRNVTERTLDEDDTYEMEVEVDDPDGTEFFPDGNSDTATFDVEEYELDIQEVRAPSEVDEGDEFSVAFRYDATVDSEVDATLDLPDELGFNSDDESKTDFARGDRLNTVRWELEATEQGDDLELTATIEDTLGLDESDERSETLDVVLPTVVESDTNAVTLENEQGDGSAEIELFSNESTVGEHNLTFTAQGDAEGRTLQGLEYLVRYPFGCVEQTTSAFLGALNTQEYYEDRPDYDLNDESPDRFERINDSIERGVERLEEDGARGQLESGGWNMWGNEFRDSETYYTSYALFGLASVQNNPHYSDDDEHAEIVDGLDDIRWAEALDELNNELQEDDGSFDAAGNFYIRDDVSMTGFVLDSVNETLLHSEAGDDGDENATEIFENASEYLIDQQEDGYWQDHTNSESASATAHALRGLQIVYDDEDVDIDDIDDIEEGDIEEAISDGHEWLIENEDEDEPGTWDEYHSSPFWSTVGDSAEETSYVALALDETKDTVDYDDINVGSDDTEDVIENATDHLTGIYESQGSWGYPRTTALAIDTLTELTDEVSTDREVTVTIEVDEEEFVNQTLDPVDEDNPDEELTLQKDDLEDLREEVDDGQEVTVEVDDEGDATGFLTLGIENVQEVREDALNGGGN